MITKCLRGAPDRLLLEIDGLPHHMFACLATMTVMHMLRPSNEK